ncbi:hypothetical protein AAAK29_20435 [Mesorhizobium sp. CCNWLW179-1]|uniref:hypothetical protein n=1 Tax=unclassified Mesorhizobium TaxID=325217 RepID=UPI0030154CB6
MKFNKIPTIGRNNDLKRVTIASLGFAISAVFSVNAQAEEIYKPKEQARSVYLVKSGSGSKVRYNKNPSKNVVKVSASQYMRSNPYVCTPSGFGQKARCYARGLSL